MSQPPLILTQTAGGTFLLPAGSHHGSPILLTTQPIATMAGRKKTCSTEEVLAILAEDSGAAILPVDSESDDEDLLQPELHPDSSDSDYVLPPSESDEDYEPSAPPSPPQPSSPASTRLRPSTRTPPQPSSPASTRLRPSTRTPPQPSSPASTRLRPSTRTPPQPSSPASTRLRPSTRTPPQPSSPASTRLRPSTRTPPQPSSPASTRLRPSTRTPPQPSSPASTRLRPSTRTPPQPSSPASTRLRPSTRTPPQPSSSSSDSESPKETQHKRKGKASYKSAAPRKRGRGGSPEGGSPEGGSPEGGSPEGGSPEGGSPRGGSPEGESTRSGGGSPRDGSPEGGSPRGGSPEGGSPRGGSPSSRSTEEDLRWHTREDKDQRPEPRGFMPARVPGPALDPLTAWSPLSLFRMFFSSSVVQRLVDNTNANALKRSQAGKKYVWKVLTVRDFYVFLAIIIFSGLVHVHHRSDYWRRKWPYNFQFPADRMSRARFEAILWSLHMSDPEEDKENERKSNTAEYDRLFKIKPLYTDIVAACKAHFQPYRNISIDERMVASKARISKKQYAKDKPIKWGYKLFVLADSSTAYTWNFFVHTGKSESTTGPGLSYSSVMDLLPLPLLGQGYTLFVDSFYTSPALFEELSTKNIGCCGTIRKNKMEFPRAELNDLPKNAERGDLRWIRRGKLLFVKWMDTREVSVCSTVHEAFSGQTVQRKVKQAGVWQTKTVPVPDAMLDYSRSMGGVDVSDTLIGNYSVHHKTMKWYKTYFYHFMDIAVVNSFLLHKELIKMRKDPSGTRPHSQKSFREQLAADMLEFAGVPAAEAAAAAPPSPPPLTCMPVYYGEDATASRKYCKNCSNAGNKRVKTPVCCRKCMVPLCFTSRKNCFKEWHSHTL
nr:piggyBac transposable element-derived protein 4-like [Pseudochaenichthys georgianus]